MKNKLFYSYKKTTHCLIIILLLITFVLLTGCSAKSGESGGYDPEAPLERLSYSTADHNDGLAADVNESAGAAFASKMEPNNQNSSVENPVIPMERKLVKQAAISIEADPSFIDSEGKLTGVNQKVDELMKKYNAYSENTHTEENSSRFTIRVPEIHYESLIAETGMLGKARSRTETAEDVTIRYYDLEGRLNTKKTLLATFQGYLVRAKDIDDIMKVETRIAELQNEIDWLGNQFTRLGNLVDYATVELTVYSIRYTTSYTLGDRIKQLFDSFGGFVSAALVVILGIIVYGGPIVIVCLVAFWLFFGRIGILKKAFRYTMRSGNEKQKKQKVLLDSIKPDSTNKNNGGNSV